MTALAVVLLVAGALLYLMIVGGLGTLDQNDPAGRGLAQAYLVFGSIALWVILAVVTILAGIRGEMPGWAKAAAFILIPASGAAALAAIELVSNRAAGIRWPIVVPALVPLLVIGFAGWAISPAAQAKLSGTTAGLIAWGSVLVLSVAPWPRVAARTRQAAIHRAQLDSASAVQAAEELERKRAEQLARFEKLTPQSPLWEWLDFADRGSELRERALDGARTLDRRQADAEEMVGRGFSGPLIDAERLDLVATPALCRSATALLEKSALDLKPTEPGDSTPYPVVRRKAEYYLPAYQWLVAKHCDCERARLALVASVRAYPEGTERNQFLAVLDRLRPAP